MKYKLKHIKTGEEHLCDKVTIDGFDYYVSNDHPSTFKWRDYTICSLSEELAQRASCCDFCQKVIATNNPNIDILKVVDEVDELALKTTLQPKVLFDELKKCSQNDALLIDGFGDYNIVRYRETTGFIQGYNKSQETHPFSEEDMIEFDKYKASLISTKKEDYPLYMLPNDSSRWLTTKELLQLWKEQQPKTVYYDK